MSKHKICIITEEAIPPLQRFSLTLRLAETLGLECEVHLVSLSSDVNFKPQNLHFHPVIVKGWDLFSLRQRIRANLKLTFKAWQVCRKYNIDLVYGWWPVAYFSAMLAGRPYATDMPEFIDIMYRSFQKPLPSLMQFPLRFFQTLVAKKSRAIVTESSLSIDQWQGRGVKKENLYVLPYGVEVDFFHRAPKDNIRSLYGIGQDKILVMYHGDIGFDDGVDILIEAVKDLDVWCLIVGDGPADYMRALKGMANERTLFTGWVLYSQMPRYLASCDIYVAPFRSSHYTDTTFPLKQMESMAAGKPTICSRLSSFSLAVRDGYDIKLITPGDINALKSAIRRLCEDSNLRSKLGKNAFITARDKFDWRVRVGQEIQILKNILRD